VPRAGTSPNSTWRRDYGDAQVFDPQDLRRSAPPADFRGVDAKAWHAATSGPWLGHVPAVVCREHGRRGCDEPRCVAFAVFGLAEYVKPIQMGGHAPPVSEEGEQRSWPAKPRIKGTLGQDLEDLIDAARRGRFVSPQEEQTLARRADATSRARLAESHLPLVLKVASSYKGRGVDYEDLVGAGVVGLGEAVERFDPDHGARLSTYARHWILKRILLLFESEHLADTPTEVKEGPRDLARRAPVDDPADIVIAREQRADLKATVSRLPERERRVYKLRYVEERSQGEVAAELGVRVRTIYNDEAALRRHLAAWREAA
jgi:RNA polymerase sigma factor (sigma-70 family)